MKPATTMKKNNYDGLTIIVLSYERMKSLQLMLESLLAQDLGDMPFELIVCNNSPRVYLKQSRFLAVGRALRKFRDVKVVNFSYSWRTATRYSLATLAKYDTVLFIDDDIILRRQDFIAYMFENFKRLKPLDILSCWNRLWAEWNEDYHNVLSLNFQTHGITELTRCDVAGPGICMFNKQILSPGLLDVVIFPEFVGAYDMGFSLIAALEHDSQCYFLPSYNMLESYMQGQKETLMDGPERYSDLHALFKSMLKRGYKPVLSRLSPVEFNSSPERRAVELLKPVKVAW